MAVLAILAVLANLLTLAILAILGIWKLYPAVSLRGGMANFWSRRLAPMLVCSVKIGGKFPPRSVNWPPAKYKCERAGGNAKLTIFLGFRGFWPFC